MYKKAVELSPNILKYRFNYCIQLENIGFRKVLYNNYRKQNINILFYYHYFHYLLMVGLI